jgi:hypothetical protein
MATYRLKEWFLTITGTANKAGTRFKDGDKPNESTFSDWFKSSLFKSEPDDRAKEDVAGTTLADINGHVVAATDAQAKANQAKKEDRTVVAQASQLPSVDSTETLTVTSDQGLDYDDQPLNVYKDDSVSTRSHYLIKLRGSFSTWLTSLASSIDSLFVRVVSVEAIAGGNTTKIAINTAAIEGLTGNNIGNQVPIGGTMQWFNDTSYPTDYLPLTGQEFDIVDYPLLYAVIGTKYDEGVIAGKFRLPNLQKTYLAGRAVASDIGTTTGANIINLDIQQIPNHRHDHTIQLNDGSDGVSAHTHSFYHSEPGGANRNGVDVSAFLANADKVTSIDNVKEDSADRGIHTHTVEGEVGYIKDRTGGQTGVNIQPKTMYCEFIIRAR